jgi:ABC-type lipoprotein export system ATPase subunit
LFSLFLALSSKKDEIVVQDDHVMAMSGLETVDLGFSDFYMELATKTKKRRDKKNGVVQSGPRILLDGSIRGRARPGRMLAIMGPSGAGKSTILHALAGRVKESSKLKLEGMRYINGDMLTEDSQVPSAFVEQRVR